MCDACSAWKNTLARQQYNFSWISQNFGDRIVDAYPHNMAFETVRPILMPIRDALAEATNPSGKYTTKYDAPSRLPCPGIVFRWSYVGIDDEV